MSQAPANPIPQDGDVQQHQQKKHVAKARKTTAEDRAQRQRDREFGQHKTAILTNLGSSACDLSPKGSVDAKCYPVMDLLNTHADYITTSSCSGRIALFHSIPSSSVDGGSSDDAVRMKRGEQDALGWLVVKHGMLLHDEMLLIVRYLCGEAATAEEEAMDAQHLSKAKANEAVLSGEPAFFSGELEGVLLHQASPSSSSLCSLRLPEVPSRGTIAIKMEPFVMHVECRTMEAAKRLLSAAVSDSGYRNSGVVPPGKKIMCGIRTTVGLGMEVPVMLDGHNFAPGSRHYVWSLLHMANEKMLGNELKMKLLERSVAQRLTQQQEQH